MRFLNDTDEQLLAKLAGADAVNLTNLERAAGDRGVHLLQALADFPATVEKSAWIAHGLRCGLVRVPNTTATSLFFSEAKLTPAVARELADGWFLPFARTPFGSLMVACAPEATVPVAFSPHLGSFPVFCVATPDELNELRGTYRRHALGGRYAP